MKTIKRYHPPTDAQLISNYLSGDPKAFTQLYEKHNEMLVSFLRHYTGLRQDGEDAAQETWIRVDRNLKLRRYNESQLFPQYLRTVGFNTVKAWKRYLRIHRLDKYTLLSSMFDPSGKLPMNITYKKLYTCLGLLSEKTQFILTLHFWHNWTFKEIAIELGASLTSVTSAASRAYKDLKELLLTEKPLFEVKKAIKKR